jgi:hypothetical protein
MTKLSLALISLLSTVSTVSHADADWEPPGKWTLGEREQWVKLREEVLDYLKLANEHCSTTIKIDFDYESFRGKFKDNENYGLDAYGRGHLVAAISAADTICKDGGERQAKAVAKGVKLIKMSHGKKGGKASSSMTYANGSLFSVIEPAGPNNASGYQTELEKFIKSKI